MIGMLVFITAVVFASGIADITYGCAKHNEGQIGRGAIELLCCIFPLIDIIHLAQS